SVGRHCRQPAENFIRNYLHTPAPSPKEHLLSCSLRETTLPIQLSERLYIDDAGEGGFHVPTQASFIYTTPSPSPPPPTPDIHKVTAWDSTPAVEILSLKSLGRNHYKAFTQPRVGGGA